MAYHLLGHERVALTREDLERMVREGILALDTKVIQDGEGFAAAISSRSEFRHLLLRFPNPNPPPPAHR